MVAFVASVSTVAAFLVATTSGPAEAKPPSGPAIGSNCEASGTRAGAQMTSHSITDLASVAFNPTNGNMLMQGTLLRMAGIGVKVSINWRYNPINDARPTLNVGKNEAALAPDGSGGFRYTKDDGGCYHFVKSGSSWVTPAGINATLTQTGSQMDLRMNPSGVHNIYSLVESTWELVQQHDSSSTTSPNTITYTYAATGGLLSKITDTQGRVITFAYDDPDNATQPSTITDTSLNRTISLVYSGPNGALSSVTNAAGDSLTFGYDATGLVTITDNRSSAGVTTVSYDSSSRASSWIYGDGSSAAATFTAAYPSGSTTTVTDPNGHTTTFTLSGGDVTTITDPLGNTGKASWDGHNNLTSTTDALANVTHLAYGNATNPNNMLSKITSPAGSSSPGSPTGAVVSTTYPTSPTGTLSDYLPLTQVDAQGDTTHITEDSSVFKPTAFSQTNSAGTPVGGTSRISYQGDDAHTNCGAKPGEECSSTTANGGVTHYGYDSAGNLTSITPPSPLGARALTYDAAGRLTSESDGRGNTEYYQYDKADRITLVAFGANAMCLSGDSVCYKYDHAGNKTEVQTNQQDTTYTYDELDRITATDGAFSGGSTSETYDGDSNLLSYTDTAGAGSGSATTTYRYDASNRLIAIAEPGGTCPAGSIPHPNATKCISIDYQSSGGHSTRRRAHVYDPNGQIVSTSYDNAGRILSVTATNGASTTFASRSYTYQTGGSPTADQDLRAKQTDQTGTSTYYCYDGFERLSYAGPANPASCTGTPPTTGITWGYDNDGNRTSTTTGGSTRYAGYNTADELCFTATVSGGTCAAPPTGATTYSSDGTGNQTSDPVGAYTYNKFNQVTLAVVGGQSSSYTYNDADNTNRTVAQEHGDNIGATLGPLGVTTTKNDTTLAITQFIRDPNGTPMAMQTGGSSYYYAQDALGSVISLSIASDTLAARYTYDPWGNLTSTPPTGAAANNPFTYAAGYTDTTGLIKFGARYYNPTTGRFTQPDPSRQGANPYKYASDNPVNHTDTSGEFDLGDFLLGSFETLSGAANIGFGIFVAGLGLGTSEFGFGVIGLFAGGAAILGGSAEAFAGASDINRSFNG